MTDLLLLTVSGWAAVVLLVVLARAAEAQRLWRKVCCYQLGLPRELTAEAVTQAWVAMSGAVAVPWRQRLVGMDAVVVEVTADDDGISHRLLVPEHLAEAVTAQLRTALPGLRLTPEAPAKVRRWTHAREWRLALGRHGPLRTDQPEAAAAAWLGALQPLGSGERISIQWALRPDAPRRAVESPKPALDLAQPQGDRHVQTAERLARQRKLAEPLWLAAGRVGVHAGSRGRGYQLLRRALGAAWALNAPGVCLRVRWLPTWLVRQRLNRRTLPLLHWPVVVNAAEVACLVGWPVGTTAAPGLKLGGCRQLPASPLIPTTGRVLALSAYGSQPRPLAIAPADRLRHLWVLGPTGSGKSTLLANLIAQDMEAGMGVVVVDPMGDLIDAVLRRVPTNRVRDVVLLDPVDDERPVGLNPLANPSGDAELVTDQIVGTFRQLYTAFWGPRSDDILRAAVATLLPQPQPYTLCEIPRLLTDGAWRQRLVARLDDPVGLEPFWGWYESLKEGERLAAIGPVLNKLRAFLLRRRVRHIIGQSQGLDMGRVLAEGRLLLVPLRKGLLGDETAMLLGGLLLARLWQATQGRAGLPVAARPPVMAYLDEFQDYLALPTNLATVLAQARGLGLGLTLAHQHLGQLRTEVRAAVLANARSKVVFQTSADDARALAREFAPYLAHEDLQGLGPHEVALTVAVAGQVSPPATGFTLPPGEPLSDGRAAATGRASATADRLPRSSKASGPAKGS